MVAGYRQGGIVREVGYLKDKRKILIHYSAMKKNCLHCNKEYEVSQFHFDNGYCQECTPSFFSLYQTTTQAETKSLFYSLIALNAFLCWFASMMLDCGTFSHPLVFFTAATIVYLTGRLLIGRFSPSGYPILTCLQRYALILFPFYGFPPFFAGWMIIRKTFFND